MRKGILAIAAVGSVFALTAAGATGITLNAGSSKKVKVGSLGTVKTILTSECTGAPALTYGYGADPNMITSVSVTGIDCTALDTGFKYVFSVKMNETGTASSANVTGVLTAEEPTVINLDPTFDAGTGLSSVGLAVTVVPTGI